MFLKDEIGCDKSINHIFKIYNKCSIIILIIVNGDRKQIFDIFVKVL